MTFSTELLNDLLAAVILEDAEEVNELFDAAIESGEKS